MLADVKVGVGVATATVTSGAFTWLDYIPEDIGKLASLIGIIVSCAVLWATIDKRIHARKKDKLEAKLLERELNL